MKLSREISLFAVGGIGGLVLDAGVVQLLVAMESWNPYLARVLSFLTASTFTWWWNRHFTFAGRRTAHAAHAEWLRWVGLMSIGALLNYGIYALLLVNFVVFHQWPAVAAAVGSATAALLNFSAASVVIFKKPTTPNKPAVHGASDEVTRARALAEREYRLEFSDSESAKEPHDNIARTTRGSADSLL